jgi:hypothetical protein
MADWSVRLDRIDESLRKQNELLDRHSSMLVDLDIRHEAARQEYEARIRAAEKRHEESVREREAWNAAHTAALDRIEALMNRQLLAAEKHHDEFATEHKELLAAQVVMNAQIDRTSASLEKLITKLDGLSNRFNGAGSE